MGAILEDLKDQVGILCPGENLSMWSLTIDSNLGTDNQSINALACINPSVRANLVELEANN